MAASLLGSVAIVLVMTALALALGYQTMRAGRLAELDRQFEQRISSLALTEDDVDAAEAIIGQMELLSPQQAQESRDRLATALQSAIERQMQTPRLDNALAEELLVACQLLKSYAPEQAQALAEQIRQRSWRTVFNVERPFDNVADVFHPSCQPRVTADGLQWAPSSTAPPISFTAHSTEGKIELEAVFDADWQQATQIGLAMLGEQTSSDSKGEGRPAANGILFKLQSTAQLVGARTSSSADAAPTTNGHRASFGARRNEDDCFFTLVLIRDGVIVQTGKLSAAQIPPSELTLRARQDGNRLTFQINDNEPIVFRELFAAQRRNPSKLGLLWPAGATLKRLTARRLAPSVHASPLEQGDLLYAQGQFAEALEHYRRQREIVDDPDLTQELDFKRAQCLMELKRGAEARPLWEDLVDRGNDRWKASALISLWVLALEEDRLNDADHLFDALSVQYSLADLAVRIPNTTRDKIVTLAVDPVVVTSLRPHPHPVRNLERALAVQNAVGVPFTDTFLTRWMLLGAYDRSGDLAAAVHFARELLDQIDHGDFRHRLVLDHYVWLEARLGAPERAHASIDRYREWNANGSVSNIAAALMMRGRLYASAGDPEAAGREMDRAMEHYQFPPAHVWMARGLVALRADQPEKARLCWDRGYAQNKRSNTRDSLKIVHTFMLGLLAEKVTKPELHQFIARATQSDFDSPAIRLVTQRMLPKVLFEESLLHLTENPRTMKLLEDWHFYRLSYEDSLVLPYRIVAHEAFTTFVLGLDRGDRHLTAEQDELLWQTTGDLYEAFKQREFNELSIAQAFFTWKGNTGLLGWASLSRTLKPAPRGPLAYIFGCHYVHLGKHKEAVQFFQIAWEDAADDVLLGTLIGQRLGELTQAAPADDAKHYLDALIGAAQAGRELGAARFALAGEFARREDWDNAAKQYAAAAIWRERTVPHDENLAAIQQALEVLLPPELAVAAYLAERDLERESIDWHQHAAVAQTRLGLLEQAAESFALALGNRPLSKWALNVALLADLLESDELCDRTAAQLSGDLLVDFLVARGQYFGSRGRWEKASDSYAALGDALPGSYVKFEYACLLLLASDEEIYAQLCQGLVERFGETSNGEIAGNCASIGGLSSASGIKDEQLRKWANLALEERRDKYSILKAAAAFYRVGDYQTAVDLLNESIARFGEDKSNAAFILALSHSCLGEFDKANWWRELGTREMTRSGPSCFARPRRRKTRSAVSSTI